MQIKLVTAKCEVSDVKFEDILKQNEKTLLYFYPKDNTPGCSVEAVDFTAVKSALNKLGIWVVGVSKDSDSSHCRFIEKKALQIDLISDPELILHKKYGAWGEKKNYGRVYEWTIRSTFLLDQQWVILQEWRNVKAKWHVNKIMREMHLDIVV